LNTPSPQTPNFQHLVGRAHRAYGAAIRTALAGEGMDDLPRRGDAILGRISARRRDSDPEGAPLSDLLRGGGITKQLGTQLMDTLVTRGYVTRETDPEDRRRMRVMLTPRGAAAAATIAKAASEIDTELIARVGTERLDAARAVLEELADLAPAHRPGLGQGGGYRHDGGGDHPCGQRPDAQPS